MCVGYSNLFYFFRPFPNVIGAVDGCHIRISPNDDERNAYYNFKRYHSIHLQAICTHDRKFTDIFVGYVKKQRHN